VLSLLFTGKDGLLVLSPGWALSLLGSDGRIVIVTDCKVDTSNGLTMFSTIRCHAANANGWTGCVVFIGPTEDNISIRTTLEAVARNVPCDRTNCAHSIIEEWLPAQTGRKRIIYQTRRECSSVNKYNPYVCHDKHGASYKAVREAEFLGSLLDRYHVSVAFESHLSLVLKLDSSLVDEFEWGFRLLTRSKDDAQAELMRYEFFSVFVNKTEKGEMSVPQCTKLMRYINTFWHFDRKIRHSFIDKTFLYIKLILGFPFAVSTGSAESSHATLDAIFFGAMVNKSVTTVVIRSGGVDLAGKHKHSYFAQEHSKLIQGVSNAIIKCSHLIVG
jgi:hypothetical protein